MDKETWVYLLRCRDGRYYVGMSRDVERRVAEHNIGIVESYTFRRRPVVLVWCDRFPTGIEAFAFERKIKGWTRAKKEALIRGDWATIRRLSRGSPRRPAAPPPLEHGER